MTPANTAAVHQRFRAVVRRARRRLEAEDRAALAKIQRLPKVERQHWRQYK